MTVVFKDISGYEGLYQISNFGDVKSFHKFNSQKRKNNEFVSLKKASNGYLFVCLYKDKKYKHFLVHRLVAQHFVEGYDDSLYVDHIDMNKENNSSSNLRWVTSRQNSTYCREKYNESTKKPIGVYFDKNCNRYKSSVRVKGKNIHIGYFNSSEEARSAYLNKIKELNLA